MKNYLMMSLIVLSVTKVHATEIKCYEPLQTEQGKSWTLINKAVDLLSKCENSIQDADQGYGPKFKRFYDIKCVDQVQVCANKAANSARNSPEPFLIDMVKGLSGCLSMGINSDEAQFVLKSCVDKRAKAIKLYSSTAHY